ncbi:OmpA family protein [Winogradskyella sp. F6397]|uniref:OmpA family protein n=1 Tax=Winogradskyella marina TaxID=2785530 RepID=A0ABS0EFD5_9FLAO|nr:OmpA family protein [Winogradskyella marina]MBF8149170.1 OmpA family protein [Winogradskyella marina]
MKPPILFLFIFYSFISTSQNLVLNPSFEDHSTYKCIVNLGGFNNGVLDWSIPNHGSTDFFDTCSEDMGANNYNGIQNPKTGSSYAGMYFYTDKNYREYVQGELSKTLVEGKKYKMTFYLSLADKSSYALKDIEVLITEEKLKPCYDSNSCEKVIKPSKVTKKKFKLYSNTEEVYFSNKEIWTEYSFEFTAEGYENYFSIGNFYRNPKTKKQQVVSNSPYFFSYYYIDDVSIEPLEKEVVIETIKTIEEPTIKTNEIHTFKNVLFDFDKADLLEVSKEELNQLYKHLEANLTLNIEIYGHTDAIGLETRNQDLSEQRAKAVSNYLITKGLDVTRITSFGFGSTQPIADNDSEEGQQLNRRVAFKLIEN